MMQLDICQGLKDLLTHRVVPCLAIQDMHALSACCHGFRTFVEVLSQDSWLLVARCVVLCVVGLTSDSRQTTLTVS